MAQQHTATGHNYPNRRVHALNRQIGHQVADFIQHRPADDVRIRPRVGAERYIQHAFDNGGPKCRSVIDSNAFKPAQAGGHASHVTSILHLPSCPQSPLGSLAPSGLPCKLNTHRGVACAGPQYRGSRRDLLLERSTVAGAASADAASPSQSLPELPWGGVTWSDSSLLAWDVIDLRLAVSHLDQLSQVNFHLGHQHVVRYVGGIRFQDVVSYVLKSPGFKRRADASRHGCLDFTRSTAQLDNLAFVLLPLSKESRDG
ncbi:hypothetical protein GN958_ATG18399 [Phytophthora infestans]|uniref:Uncharacterized protein n=1 Tax=Phytophthora infestans TaxID=4787 RepID=A0A8S9TZX6_PHYIN|nr:hypothetical protein GN958_ATG18399 [Phytophthora infestans]